MVKVNLELEAEDLKITRELLCAAQSELLNSDWYPKSYSDRIQTLITQIDTLRPLGSNGKHGDRHTEFCGCEDNPYRELLHEWRVIPSFPMYELAGIGNIRVAGNSNPRDPEEITARYSGDNGELEYDLCALRDGYLRNYTVPVRNLINETFPELGEKEQ